VACYGGLSNRLRVLTSGLALAEATGRRFTMLWPVRNKSGAPYEALFQNDWNVVTQDPAPPSATWLPEFGGEMNRDWYDLAAATAPEIALSCATWLVEPAWVPSHAPLWQRTGELLNQLQPVPAVAERVAAFRAAHFRPQMIGVHLRRVEFNRLLPFSAHNTGPAIAAIRRLLTTMPAAGLFLSTDDGGPDPVTGAVQREGVREKLRAAFGDRVVWTEPRTLACGAVEGVQDALVDLLLLRATDAVVGTWFSSFSELAGVGRPVPLIYCRSGGAWAAAEWALRASGGLAALRYIARTRYAGRVHPLTVLQYLLRTPRREAARAFKRLTPQLFGRVRALVRTEARPDA
jgi:hypothetical protein